MGKLKTVIDKLLKNQELEPKYKDHALTGNWNGYRDVISHFFCLLCFTND